MEKGGGGYRKRGKTGRLEPIGSSVQTVWEGMLSNVGLWGTESVGNTEMGILGTTAMGNSRILRAMPL